MLLLKVDIPTPIEVTIILHRAESFNTKGMFKMYKVDNNFSTSFISGSTFTKCLTIRA